MQNVLKINTPDGQSFQVLPQTLGVSLVSPWSRMLEAADASKATKAKKVIYFYMGGAMSHIDTFDPKPDRPDIQGDVGVVKTKTPGIVFGEHMTQSGRTTRQTCYCSINDNGDRRS
jgi:hypothetical protein